MTDREKLEAVANGYNEIMALQQKQRDTTAKMIRACLSRIKSTSPTKRQEGYTGLLNLAIMLETPRV